jgi:uncharacterized membrane protein YwzB
MTGIEEQRHEKRLNWTAYANIGLGLFTLLAWAIPGPVMAPSLWRNIDQDFHGESDPVVVTMAMVFKVGIVVIVVVFWLLSAVSLTNGVLIPKRTRHQLCMILSGISLLGTPFHLIVGIFSLITLNNDWARKLFANDRGA